MYRITTPGYCKSDQAMRWALPDRIFFACGACHVLAYAFLERYEAISFQVFWQKPDPGFIGNHVFVSAENWVFDYHGYSDRKTFLAHTYLKANRWWPGWNATLVPLTRDALVSEAKSRTYEGLWLREPKQFLHDALPRARGYLTRFPSPLEPCFFKRMASDAPEAEATWQP